MSTDHSKFIKRCFELAKKGRGFVSPNPLVGAVLVKNDKVIGEGWHKKFGEVHAEVNAIKNTTEEIADSTLYCNLEPCCHSNKQTPPCVPLIIQKKIKRVVISNADPNQEVDGEGVRQLRIAGIEVTTGILEEEGKELNKFYFKYVQEKLPYITLKIAQSLDGKISLSKKEQTWLTGKESTKFVHKLRSEYDAVLVGAGTIRSDNPLLTVRKVRGRNPVRVIVDGKFSIPVKSKVIEADDPQNTWIFTSLSPNEKKVNLLSEKGVKIFTIKSSRQNKLEIKKIIKILAEQKITSILIEGGSDIFTQFISEELFNEIIILQTPKILGKGINAFKLDNLKRLNLLSVEKLGEDIKLVYGQK